jgi:hypothetical protein
MRLQDDGVIGEKGENLYPVRYAAAWALFGRVQDFPMEVTDSTWEAIESAADHLDPQLAAPSLLALGIGLKNTPRSSGLEVLRGPQRSEARIALCLMMFGNKAEAKDFSTRYDLLTDGHPIWSEPTEAADGQDWPIGEVGRAWLEGLKGDDVEVVLRWLARHLTGIDFVDDDFVPWDLRRKKRIPLTTTSELFGME